MIDEAQPGIQTKSSPQKDLFAEKKDSDQSAFLWVGVKSDYDRAQLVNLQERSMEIKRDIIDGIMNVDHETHCGESRLFVKVVGTLWCFNYKNLC